MRYLLGSLTSKIKSPILIYFILAAVFFNRKVIFQLIFSEINATEKLAYFEANTTIKSLLIYPSIIAIAYALLLPWINFLFSYLTSKANEKKESLQATVEHRILMKKDEMTNVRASLLEAEERSLIDKAKREEEIQNIKNDEVRETLEKEISELRNSN